MLSSKFKSGVVALTLAAALAIAPAAPAFAALSGSLKVGGSTTVAPLAQSLANNFAGRSGVNKHVTITVYSVGSGNGINGAQNGTYGLGMSSNALSDKNLSDGLVPTAMARDALSVVVNKSNKVKALTWAQCKGIWTGSITNWKQVGGVNHKIDVTGRAAGSGTGDFWNQNILTDADGKAPWTKTGNATLVSTISTYNSNGELRNDVASDKYAIGYVGMAYVTGNVRAVKFNGYLPNRTNAKSGKYPIVRLLYWVTLGQPTGLAKSFIAYSLSSKGQALCNKLYLSLK